MEMVSFVTENDVKMIFLPSVIDDIGFQQLVKIIQNIKSEVQIVLVSSKKEDAYYAWELNLAGFLLKPVDKNHLNALLCKLDENCNGGPVQKVEDKKLIHMSTMPRFNMYVNDELVTFRRKKGKELMAFLVNADGEAVDADMVVEALWEGEPFGRSQKNRCFVLINCLKNFLKDLGLDGLFIAKDGLYKLNKGMYTSDLENMLAGDKELLLNYDHRYMMEYSWAERRRGVIDRMLEQR